MKNSRQHFNMLLICNVLLTILLMDQSLFAQNAPILFKNDIDKMNARSSSTIENQNTLKLLNSTHPSTYVYNGNITGELERPVIVFTDMSSLKSIYSISNRGTIECISIQIKSKSELSMLGLLSDLKKFPRIKIIKLDFEFEINPQDFSSLIPYHEDFSWVVVYEVVKPS